MKTMAAFVRDYELGAQFAKGGFGQLYRGHRKVDKKPVAIKFVTKKRARLMKENDTIELAEIFFMRKTAHINGVIQFYDYFELETSYAIILEYLDQYQDLNTFVDHNPNEEQIKRIMKQLWKIMHRCHKAGVLHGDLSDCNVMVHPETLDTKLIDFGAAAYLLPRPYYRFYGTLEYAPPEYFNNRHYTADGFTVWSFGILLFFLFKKDIPFENDMEIIKGDLKFDSMLISLEAKDLIKKCLNMNCEERIAFVNIKQHPWFNKYKSCPVLFC